MKLKSLLISAGLSLTLGVCAFAGISASRNNMQKASAYSAEGLTQVTSANSDSFVGCTAYVIGSNTSYGLTNYGSGQFRNSGTLLELTIAEGTSGSALKLVRKDNNKYLSNPTNGSWSDSEATVYLGDSNRLAPNTNSDTYWWVVKYEGVSYYETHNPGAIGSATSYFYVYAEPAPEPDMQTIYLDLGKTNWNTKGQSIYVHYWGGVSSSTWPGVAMTKDTFGLYTATVDATSTGLKFHVGADLGGDCETGDLSLDDSKMLWTLDSQGSPCTASCQAYATERVYVLDKRNNPLCERQKLHAWRDGYQAATTWPGIDMTNLSGYIYYADIPSIMDRVIFNEGTQQTATLARVSDPCFVIEPGWSGAWTSLKAAQFVDGYMKFATIAPSDDTKGTACKEGWSALYTAYTTTYADDHAKIIAIADVADRLAAWAEANGATFNPENGALSTASSLTIVSQSNSYNSTMIIIVVTSLVLISVGGFFFIRKRKEN